MTYSTIKCPSCDLSFKQESRFRSHLSDVHGIVDHLTLFLDGKQHPTCQCSSSCSVLLPWAGWKKGFVSKFARGHNARLDSVYLDKEKQRTFVQKRIEGYRSGKYKIWNSGLTKNTSEIVKKTSQKISLSLNEGYAMGKITDWHVQDVEKAKKAAQKSSETKQRNFASGEAVPWNKGLTKKTLEDTQLEIFDFVKSLGVSALSCDRSVISPNELGTYIPEHKLAIEYNSLHFHNTNVIPDQKYHQKKLDACSEKKINLLSVYEDEWRDKRFLIENMIKHRLKISNEVFDARKTKIVQLNSKESKQFFDQNHLEKNARSTVSFGLKDPKTDKILAAASLRRPFHKSHSDKLEVARCCCLSGVSVRGWLGKLTAESMKYARLRGAKSLMTYVDSRVGLGLGYLNAGWTFERTTGAPRFWWTDFHDRFNRFKFKADKSRNMTQQQVAVEAGVVPIFGCTNSIMKIDL